MSARDAINIIKTLPTSEIREVEDFIKTMKPKTEQVMDREKAREISRQIMAEDHELFRKLAQ